jgi:hypothetical protein
VTNGISLFLLSALETDVFTTPSACTVVLKNVTNTVSVLAPAAPDSGVVPLLESMTLPRIIMNCGRADLDAGLKTVCQQTAALAPDREIRGLRERLTSRLTVLAACFSSLAVSRTLFPSCLQTWISLRSSPVMRV